LAIWAAFALVISAETSDLIDGYVARSSSQESNFGKILDPMADCLYRGSVFIAFVINGWMAVWMLSIIVWRDLTVSYLREIAELRSETLGARASGKWKAIVQGFAQITIVGMAAIFGKAAFAAYQPVVQALLLLATAVTAYSLVDYASGVLQRTWRLR
jgi:CDP-diacylglycerol--glycerol-3-phosphate 3-phosphatidyltransferase